LVAYIGGLVTTIGVMHAFHAAQPALLYLVPACTGSIALLAFMRGEWALLNKYSEGNEADAAAEKVQ
jgi:minor histocompatibility antigen H13